jgi:general stress protein 26
MEKIHGMQKAFKEAKFVYLITTSKEGEKRTRPMTNFNKSPYEPMWFPTFTDTTFTDTRKIRDIRHNPLATISFPAKKWNSWYNIEGEADEASRKEVQEKWKWWILEWVPKKERKPLLYDKSLTGRSIIWINPVKAELTQKDLGSRLE